MVYTKKRYPTSMKNLEHDTRIKAIDILNAMLKNGYEEENAIPIAISQAKKWMEQANEADLKELRKKDITKHQKNSDSAHLQEADVKVYFDHNKQEWAVESIGSVRVSSYHKTKSEAKRNAKKIAENRESKLIVKRKKDTK